MIRFPLFYYFGKIGKSRYLSNKAFAEGKLRYLYLQNFPNQPLPPQKFHLGCFRSINQFDRIRRKGNIRVDVGSDFYKHSYGRYTSCMGGLYHPVFNIVSSTRESKSIYFTAFFYLGHTENGSNM